MVLLGSNADRGDRMSTALLDIADDCPDVGRIMPLVVDLDGTLIRSDLLIESFFTAIGRNPLVIGDVTHAAFRGKAALKELLASKGEAEPARLPYDDVVLSMIRAAREEGRDVYLASASNWRHVKAVADHLGIFTGWIASEAAINLSGVRKAAVLVERFGDGQFDYVGNDRVDLEVWQHAAQAISVRASANTRAALARLHPDVICLDPEQPPILRRWLQLLRVHQYAKNGLLLVPLLTAHAFNLPALVQVLIGIVAFSLCASSVYLLNDLIDINADRAHPTKHLRPLASGTIPILHAVMAAPLLLLAAFALALFIGPEFVAVLGGYYCLTTAYSFWLKRKMLIDVVALASLYTIRVLAGAAAIDVTVSEWLLGFSVFIFMSLALIKRYVELAVRLDLGMPDPTNRNYKLNDLPIVATMAAVCGFNAITVLALYISSPDVHVLYREPRLLWLLCVVLMYWIGRMLLMAHRRWVPEDPIIFALQDRVSLITLGTCLVLMVAAYL
jgi:4-hydroxybenzoate polyprenyltransferase